MGVPRSRRFERAQDLVEDALIANPSGLPSIALMDRLERSGIAEHEGMALLRELAIEGRLKVQAGRIVLRMLR